MNTYHLKGILESIKQRHDYTSMNDTYSELFFKLLKKIEKNYLSNINFRSTPNMNIVYVKNLITFQSHLYFKPLL